ncbi:translation elongation factor 4 [Patescibacteria group bacterium]|nr:translation elongation factor 4 [Patescibacteria group bacterium]MBU1563752.1 translation elongation factor 4 [Patescibacteria group bacterium]
MNIRNFSIISHIDAGKSTLADRLLELTGTVEQRKMHSQFLDMMELEKEKGITIKLQPVRMEYNGYILNLIDTPGHVDFSYEVSRSLAAVEGAILLVDASQGVQAQTLANLHLAQDQKLVIIPVINKIDLSHAQVEKTTKEMSQLLQVKEEDIIRISAKNGTNVEKILEAIIERIPPAQGKLDSPLRALIFDSSYDSYKGVIAYVRIVDGQIKANDKITMMASKAKTDVIEVGALKPEMVKIKSLSAGQIGYIATGLKNVNQCRVGDTITNDLGVSPLIGYQEPKPMVFASFYPTEAEDYDLLKDGLSKLELNDAALQYEPESCEGLGRGFRCGFLGMLHLEIILERLKREYKLNLIVTTPSVSYQIIVRNKKEQVISSAVISSANDLPEMNLIDEIREPWVSLEIITPNQYIGSIMKLLEGTRGEYKDTQYLSPERVLIEYHIPLNEIIVDFYDQLKNTTSGYASMNYKVLDYRKGDLVKMDILVAGDNVEAFSRIIHRESAFREGRSMVKKLKEVIPKHLFSISLQAAVGGNIIARETISAMRKDVTGYLYGGDYSRKKKLLEKQKKGKKKMKALGKIEIPQEVFFKVLKK